MGVELANYNTHYYAMDGEEEDVVFIDRKLVLHIRQALKSASLGQQGDSNNYNELVGKLHKKFTDDPTVDEVERGAMLVATLKALSEAVCFIDSLHHSSLLDTVLNMRFWDYEPAVMDALVELLISLATSSGKNLDLCLEMLVKNFIPPPSYLEALKHPSGIAKKEQVLVRVHSALKDIADLVPLAPIRLLSIVIRNKPPKWSTKPALSIYVENMLKLDVGALRELLGSGELITAVIDYLIELDVDILWDENASEDSAKGIFQMELEEEVAFVDAEKDGDEFPLDFSSRKILGRDDTADKLDSLLALTFEHLKLCKDMGILAQIFESLLQTFVMTVARTYKSKFTQFVMFFACSLDPEYCGKRFANFLADIFERGNFPMDRMSAVAYLASYLARARFLETEFVAQMLKRVMDWCSVYSKIQNGAVNPVMHNVFYAGCQAVMYALCFQMRPIMDTPGTNPGPFLNFFHQILKNSLDPLKVCLPSIVEEFVRQVNAADLLDELGAPVFNDMLESDLSRAFGGKQRLDMFFPFDPCLLRKCDSFIRPHYRFWSMVVTTYDDADAECNSDEDAPNYEIDICTNELHGEENDDFPEDFSDSLQRMSITPRDTSYMRKLPSKIRPSASPGSL